MTFISTTVLALSMSADAFAVAVGRGAAHRKPKVSEALRTGIIFGMVEAITPIIGWVLGYAASNFVRAVDHWIAFSMLSIIGLKMIYECFKTPPEEKEQEKTPSIITLMVTAIATSIDAMAVGVSLAFVKANIFVISAAIGMATFIMVTIGMLTGQYFGRKIGNTAEGLGGLGLICIGSYILFEHLTR